MATTFSYNPRTGPVYVPPTISSEEVLAQVYNPDETGYIPERLETQTVLIPVQRMGGGYTESQKINPEYEQYATRVPYTMGGFGGNINEYKVPTGQTFQGQPLIATYDAQGNFQYAGLPEGQTLTLDPSQPNILAQPRFNSTGGITNYGVYDVNQQDLGGFGSFLSELVSDFGPMIALGLGANYLAGNLGGLLGTGAAGAGAAGGGNAAALINAGMGGTAAQAASAAANLATTTAGLNAAVAAGGGLVPGVTANFLSPEVISSAGGAGGAGSAATSLGLPPASTPPTSPPVEAAAPPPVEAAAPPPVEAAAPPPVVPPVTDAAVANDALARSNITGGLTSDAVTRAAAAAAAAVPDLSSLGEVGSTILKFAKDNPSISGALLGAVTSAIGAKDAPTSQTATTSIDPQIKAEYLANLERAKQTAAGLEARQIAQPGQLYNDAERNLYNLGMTPFGAEDIARFFNPFQEQVVQGALGDIERTRLMQEQSNRDAATRARAFGGSRQGVVTGMTNEAALRQAATTGAQLRSTGFNTAANLGLQARPMTMAGLQTSLGLGTTRTALEQARLDALRNLGTERLGITSGALGLQPANVGGTTSQPLYNNTAGSLLSGGLTGAYIGSLLGK